MFQPLSTLPPSQPTDHTITLLPNSAPVNVRPYCYPHYQKKEIENQVASMLSQGHIQHSSSPFLWRPQNNDWFNSNDLNNRNHGKNFFLLFLIHLVQLFGI